MADEITHTPSTTTGRGGKKISVNGYLYTKHKQLSDGSFRWRCTKRDSNRCCGSLKASLNGDNPRDIIQHNHVVDNIDFVLASHRQQMKIASRLTFSKPQAVLANALVNLSEAAQRHHPNLESTKRTLRRERSRNMPRDAASIDEIIIEGQWSTTGQDGHGEIFLLHDNGIGSHERVIVFATRNNLMYLCEADTWFVDGNFAMAPHHFAQIYVLLAKRGELQIPVVYALLQRKTQTSYEIFFKIIQDKCEEFDLVPDPQRIMLDFELAAINAITTVFGNEIVINCCFFHLCQATFRKVQELGLVVMYNDENLELKHFVGMLDALAFLPIDRVAEGMAHLRTITPAAAEPLIDYFDSTYVTGTLRQRRQAPEQLLLQFRRVPPRFPPVLWNVNHSTINNEPRTNNVVEGWNNKLSHLVGHQHPTVWKIIRSLQMEQASNATILAQHQIGGEPPRKRTSMLHVNLQLRLQRLCVALNNGERTVPNFLSSVGHTIRI
jgi:hypothetical protein